MNRVYLEKLEVIGFEDSLDKISLQKYHDDKL